MYNTRIPTIKYWAEEDRPRERFVMQSGACLSNAELIAILIGSGNADESAVALAMRILTSVDNDLNRLAKLTVADLLRFKGTGVAKAVTLTAAVELFHNRMLAYTGSSYTTDNTAANAEMINTALSSAKADSLWVVVINGGGYIQYKEEVTSFEHTRSLLQIVLEHQALSMILVHKKPVRQTNPIRSEVTAALQLIESGTILSICLLDYLILHPEGYYSYRDNGYLTYLDS